MVKGEKINGLSRCQDMSLMSSVKLGIGLCHIHVNVSLSKGLLLPDFNACLENNETLTLKIGLLLRKPVPNRIIWINKKLFQQQGEKLILGKDIKLGLSKI